MQNRRIHLLVAAFLVVVLGLSGFALLKFFAPQPLMQRFVQIGEKNIAVEVADTDALRAQGLSGRASLSEGSGMLFVFESSEYWGIWMKDMRFPIDIVWLDAEGKVITIVAEASPGSYPQVFVPTAAARYVLELPAGEAVRHGIAEGSRITL